MHGDSPAQHVQIKVYLEAFLIVGWGWEGESKEKSVSYTKEIMCVCVIRTKYIFQIQELQM